MDARFSRTMRVPQRWEYKQVSPSLHLPFPTAIAECRAAPAINGMTAVLMADSKEYALYSEEDGHFLARNLTAEAIERYLA